MRSENAFQNAFFSFARQGIEQFLLETFENFQGKKLHTLQCRAFR